MAIGKIGTYATTDKTANYVGDALSNLGNVAFRDRQFKQEQADKVQAQKTAQAKALQDEANAVKIPDLKTVTSLNSNLERLKAKTAIEIQDKVLAIKNKIANTQDRSELGDLQGKLSQATLAFDTLNDFSTKVNDNIKYLVDNKDKIDPDSYDEQMAKYTMASKGYGQIRLDDNMHPVFDSTDENGNILKEEGSTNKSLSDFFVNNAQNLMLKSTFNDDVDKVIDKIGKVESKNENGQTITTRISPTKEAISTAKETLFNELLNKKNNVYRVAKDNGIKPDDVDSLRKIVDKTIDSKLNITTKNEINTAEKSRIDRLNKDARDEKKEDESYTPDTEIPVDLQRAGLEQGKNTIVTVQNSKAKPSVSFEQKGTGKNVNFKNVSLQQISRVVENGKPRYIVKVSHLKPNIFKAEGGEDLGNGQKAKKGEIITLEGDTQTSEVMKVSEATALLLAKSKKIRNKEDLRKVTQISETKAETKEERLARMKAEFKTK